MTATGRVRRVIRLGWLPDPTIVDSISTVVAESTTIASQQQQLDDRPGPNMRLRVTGLCAAVLVLRATQRSATLFLTDVHRLLNVFTAQQRQRLGLHPTKPITYRQVTYLVEQLTIDNTTSGDPATRIEELFFDLNERFIAHHNIPTTGAYAIDSTFVETWGRVYGGENDQNRQRGTSDPEAKEGHWPSKNGVGSRTAFGYDLHTATMVPHVDHPAVPGLIRAIRLEPATNRYSQTAVQLVDQLNTHTTRVTEAIVDRGYSMKLPENFATLMHQRHVKLTIDLATQDRSLSRTSYRGLVVRDGHGFCPCAPNLDSLPPVSPHLDRTTKIELRGRYDERANYQFSRRADAGDGYTRYECPARAGRVRCPLVPASLRLDNNHPTINRPPHNPDHACTQATITVPPDIIGRYNQRHPYGTTRHGHSYDRRTAVERSNAYMQIHYGTLDRKTMRVYKLNKRRLLLALNTVAINLSIIESFNTTSSAPKTRAKRRPSSAN